MNQCPTVQKSPSTPYGCLSSTVNSIPPGRSSDANHRTSHHLLYKQASSLAKKPFAGGVSAAFWIPTTFMGVKAHAEGRVDCTLAARFGFVVLQEIASGSLKSWKESQKPGVGWRLWIPTAPVHTTSSQYPAGHSLLLWSEYISAYIEPLE